MNKPTKISVLILETIGIITFVVFLILKLNHVIDWHWFWIVLPLWVPTAIFFTTFSIVALVIFIFLVIERIKERKND